jgi:hypothetical protein
MIFNCIPSIKECNANYAQFVYNSLSFIISINENQALILERRWDSLMGFTSIWPSYSYSITAQLFCIILLKQEIQLSLDTTAHEQSFNHTLITNLIEKCSRILELTDLVSMVLNLLRQLRHHISPVYISIACLCYGDLLRMLHEILFEDITMIIDDLHAWTPLVMNWEQHFHHSMHKELSI